MGTQHMKHVTSWRGLAAVLAVLLVLVASVPGLAQTGPETMNFQGRLLDGDGNPVTEPRCMRFRLCSDADCAESPWPLPSAEFEYHLVIPEDGTYKAGLFTAALGSVYEIEPALLYNWDTLFLELGVASPADPCSELPPEEWETMLPRSELRTSAYAQRSRRVRTTESGNVPLVEVVNTSSGGAVYGQTTSGIGVRGISGGVSGQIPAVQVGVWGDTNAGIGVLGYSSSAPDDMAGVAGWATAASGQTYGVWGSTSSDDGYGVYGKGTQIGMRGVGGIQSDISADRAVGVWGDSLDGTGVLGFTSGTGDQAGVAGWANASSGSAYGVYGRSMSDGGVGVYGMGLNNGTVGIASATSDTTYGVYGRNASASGAGVYGESLDASGLGVHGHSDGSGEGVRGTSIDGNGVAGYSTTGDAVAGTSTNGSGVWGASTNGYGVYSQGDAHVEGNLTWQTRTGYITVGPPAFHTYSTAGYTEHDVHEIGLSVAYSSCSEGEYIRLLANLQLPHGATLTKMTLHWKDASAVDDIELQLARSSLDGSWDLVTAIDSFGGDGNPTSTDVAIPGGYATVDNAQYSYGLRLWVYCETWVYGVTFEYEYTEPY